MKIRCCKNCENKGCGAYHDECEKYLAEKEQLLKEAESKRKQSIITKTKKTVRVDNNGYGNKYRAYPRYSDN